MQHYWVDVKDCEDDHKVNVRVARDELLGYFPWLETLLPSNGNDRFKLDILREMERFSVELETEPLETEAFLYAKKFGFSD